MNRLRFSIAGLMAFVVLVAAGFTALRYPSELVASLAFALVMGAMLMAPLGVAFQRGPARLWWAGFAAFGWGYLALALGTGALIPPALPSSLLISYLGEVMLPPRRLTGVLTGTNAISFGASGSTRVITPLIIPFRQIGHCLGLLVWALLGGLMAGVFSPRDGSPSRSGRTTKSPVTPDSVVP